MYMIVKFSTWDMFRIAVVQCLAVSQPETVKIAGKTKLDALVKSPIFGNET